MKYMLVIAYDGSKFYGFQRQKDVKSVQKYLEDGISNILKEEIAIKGAGRTDRGVHALGQVVHFETNQNIYNLQKDFNCHYPDVRIKKIKKVSSDFHARHSTKSKTYLYKIDLSNSLDNNYYLLIRNELNIKEMQDAAKEFLGTHDFRNFVGGKRLDYVTTITKIKIKVKKKILYLKFTGVGFYRYMIRNLVGALIEVGKNKISSDVLKEMLAHPEVEKRLPTSSPNGLYLVKIRY